MSNRCSSMGRVHVSRTPPGLKASKCSDDTKRPWSPLQLRRCDGINPDGLFPLLDPWKDAKDALTKLNIVMSDFAFCGAGASG